jgi:pimeloyl-ACP methyl ester carboxylesterase
LIIWGKQDPHLSHQMAPLSLAYCQAGQLVMIENATHWVQHDQPERVNQLMLEHLIKRDEQGGLPFQYPV